MESIDRIKFKSKYKFGKNKHNKEQININRFRR